ncbi:hypothetical protein C8R45DRAFT_998860 [Mycena sanguinolenta]|nr:hypothetical protein C8R45DRAFT_998860 [Mycena sanguinolenta]
MPRLPRSVCSPLGPFDAQSAAALLSVYDPHHVLPASPALAHASPFRLACSADPPARHIPFTNVRMCHLYTTTVPPSGALQHLASSFHYSLLSASPSQRSFSPRRPLYFFLDNPTLSIWRPHTPKRGSPPDWCGFELLDVAPLASCSSLSFAVSSNADPSSSTRLPHRLPSCLSASALSFILPLSTPRILIATSTTHSRHFTAHPSNTHATSPPLPRFSSHRFLCRFGQHTILIHSCSSAVTVNR